MAFYQPSYAALFSDLMLLREKYKDLSHVMARKEGQALRLQIQARLYKALHKKASITASNFPVATFEEYFGHLAGVRFIGLIGGDCFVRFEVKYHQHLDAFLGHGWWEQIWGAHEESTCIFGPLCCHEESARVELPIEVIFERRNSNELMGELHLSFGISKTKCLIIPVLNK
jgi:hypothetical protein